MVSVDVKHHVYHCPVGALVDAVGPVLPQLQEQKRKKGCVAAANGQIVGRGLPAVVIIIQNQSDRRHLHQVVLGQFGETILRVALTPNPERYSERAVAVSGHLKCTS